MPFRQKLTTQVFDKLEDAFDVDDGNREVPVNMTLTSDGLLQKDYGIDHVSNGFFSDPVTSIFNFKKKDGTQYLLMASGTFMYVWDFDYDKGYKAPTSQANITGTVAVTQGSKDVVGTGTSFTSALAVNDTIEINGETRTVASITDNTNLVLDEEIIQATGSGLTLKKNTDATYTDGGSFGFRVYDNVLYFGNAIDSFSHYDGVTITKDGALPKGNIYEVFEDRLFISGVTAEPLTVYYSNTGVPTTFAAASVLNPLGTDKVTGLVEYYSNLIIFKEESIWKMTFIYDQVAAAFLPKLENINRNYGCIGRKAHEWVENQIWFFTGKEVRALGFRSNNTGVLGLDGTVMSNQIKATLDDLNESEVEKSILFYFDRKAHLVVPKSTTNDLMFVSHLLYERAWCKVKDRAKAQVVDFTIRDETVYFASGNENNVYKWSESFNDLGNAISCYVNFRKVENKDFSRSNIFRYLGLQFKNLQTEVTGVLMVDSFDIRNKKTKEFLIGTEAEGQENSLGEIPFGENLFANAFGEDVVKSNFIQRKISFLMKGQAIQVGMSHDTLDESFTLASFSLQSMDTATKYYSHKKVISM